MAFGCSIQTENTTPMWLAAVLKLSGGKKRDARHPHSLGATGMNATRHAATRHVK
jgi:hypothetical protein